MVAPLSIDLKKRIVSWYFDEGLTMKDVAERAQCSAGLVSKVITNYREFGLVASPLTRRGRPKTLNEGDIHFLKCLYEARPTAFLDEVRDQLASVRNVHVSLATVCRELDALQLTLKDLTKRAAEADEDLRKLFDLQMEKYQDPRVFLFLDESAVDDKTIQRTRGRSLAGTPCVSRATFLRGIRYSMLPALSYRGIEALQIIEGSITKERFLEFLRTDICPILNPYPMERSVVVMDNCSIHHDEEVRRLICDECQAHLIYLPPYSPDFNPIEEAFSAIKAFLRRNEHLYTSAEQMPWLISLAVASISSDDALGWFSDCGYI